MGTIRVRSSKSYKGYNVKIRRGLIEDIGKEIVPLSEDGRLHVVLITDDNVSKIYLEKTVSAIFRPNGRNLKITFTPLLFPSGEGSKNFSTLSQLLEHMATVRLTRSGCVVALGGGVVGDVAGFAAGCYMRGIKFIQVPTTLLAMVDSSVGGKTAIDLKAGKNLAGLFYQPSMVLCDPDFLNTLPEEEYKCGLAEALKTGILSGGELFDFFEKGTARENIESVIAGCIQYKAEIVHRDEKEKHERKLLNLGHTIGHAIEKCSGYEIKHGLAVSMGLGIIIRASARLGWCKRKTARRILNTMKRNKLPVTCSGFNPLELAEAVLLDKKRSDNSITLVIPSEVGSCELKEVRTDHVAKIISLGMGATQSEC